MCFQIRSGVRGAVVVTEIRGLVPVFLLEFHVACWEGYHIGCLKQEGGHRKTMLFLPQSKVTTSLSLATQLNFCLWTVEGVGWSYGWGGAIRWYVQLCGCWRAPFNININLVQLGQREISSWCDYKRNTNLVALSSFCRDHMISSEDLCSESRHCGPEPMMCTAFWQISGIPFNETLWHRFAAALHFQGLIRRRESVQRNVAPLIKFTVLCNQWASSPLRHMAYRRRSLSARCHWQPLTMKL